VEANSTGGQGSHRAVAPSDDDDDGYSAFGMLSPDKAGVFKKFSLAYHRRN
jgi:hypothetical protein